MANMQQDVVDVEASEENLITFYFQSGFQYKEICMILWKCHDCDISLRTLKRRIKSYGLKRRGAEYDIDRLKEEIKEMVEGPDCL